MRGIVYSAATLWLLGGVAAQNSSKSTTGDGISDLELISQRRKYDLAQFPTSQWIESIQTYLDTQKDDGTWDDVNYATGCDAQRANWPIQLHWDKLITLASAWTGLNPSIPSQWTNNEEVLSATKKGMDYWFNNDYDSSDCIGKGGKSDGSCPCGTPGLWNTNWFDQVILIPQLMTTTCLLLDGQLSDLEMEGCVRIGSRPYDRSNGTIDGIGILTGANLINVMQNSVSLGLYTKNDSILDDAFNRAFGGVQFSDGEAQDGIHRDGSFLQHNGLLYNGNYGKDLINAFVQLEGEAMGTVYAASDSTRDAFATDIRGSEWMIFVDQQTGRELWDYNVVGRFVGFPTSDNQANSDINFNVSNLATAVSDFEGSYSLNDTITRLESNGTKKLVGNKGFWTSDYMVHRRDSFVLGNKMLSNRSKNTEYTNSANPYGYHLGQGTLFSYVTGQEYSDIMDAWDWNLIPGTTTLLNSPTLGPESVDEIGKSNWVGSVSDGWVGTSVEDYVDPYDANVAYKKMWFYLDDCVVVTTTDVSRPNTSSAVDRRTPVVTVLDNRRSAPDDTVWVDGQAVDVDPSGTTVNGLTLYYGGNGYISLTEPFSLNLAQGNRTGNWSAISTSTLGNTTVPIFSAYTTIPSSTYSYAFYPATDQDTLAAEVSEPTYTLIDDNGVIGVAGAERLTLVFWPGGSQTTSVALDAITWAKNGSITVTSEQPAAYLFATRANGDGTRTLVATISDPSQRLDTLSFSLTSSGVTVLRCADEGYDTGCSQIGDEDGVEFTVRMPTGGLAGSSVFRDILLQ